MKTYARRGVFRSFSQTAPGDFRFHWLWNRPFHLTFDPNRGALSFQDLLPNIPSQSELAAALKAFIKSCYAPGRPAHRRLDASRISPRYSNRQGTVTLTFVILDGDYSGAVRRSLNLIQEILLGFLNVHHPEYTTENFELSDE